MSDRRVFKCNLPVRYPVQSILAALLVIGSTGGLLAQQVVEDSLPFEVDAVVAIPFGSDLAMPAGYALGDDGAIYIAGLYSGLLRRIEPDGKVAWTIGGQGDGPGEFKTLYRLAIDGRGNIWAYDFGRNDITVFSADGQFIRRAVLEMRFRQADRIVIVDDRLVVSGVAARGSKYNEHAIHVFNDSLEHVFSFGELPETEDKDVLPYWGAGNISHGLGHGTLVYVRRHPYQLVFYEAATPASVPDSLTLPLQLYGSPEQAYVIERWPSYSIRNSDKNVTRPFEAMQLGSGWILTGRATGEEVNWDVLSPDRSTVFTKRMPSGWRSPIAYDPDRNFLWFHVKSELEPKVYRATITWPSGD